MLTSFIEYHRNKRRSAFRIPMFHFHRWLFIVVFVALLKSKRHVESGKCLKGEAETKVIEAEVWLADIAIRYSHSTCTATPTAATQNVTKTYI